VHSLEIISSLTLGLSCILWFSSLTLGLSLRKVKNSASEGAKSIKQIGARHRLILTGTPGKQLAGLPLLPAVLDTHFFF
jgi:hypothetical protein